MTCNGCGAPMKSECVMIRYMKMIIIGGLDVISGMLLIILQGIE